MKARAPQPLPQTLKGNLTVNKLPIRPEVTKIVGHRGPTPSEIKFGHGATHYKTFPVDLWKKSDGSIKRFIVCPHDHLRYYR